jgi:hypothetical protein
MDRSSPNYSFEFCLLCASLALVLEELCQPKIQMNSADWNDPRTARAWDLINSLAVGREHLNDPQTARLGDFRFLEAERR